MRGYLSRSVHSFNRNKLLGVLAETEFRRYLTTLGFANQVSAGGWISRSEARGDASFAENAIVYFPEILTPGTNYAGTREAPRPHLGLHTICATFHQLGIKSYFCSASVDALVNGIPRLTWRCQQLGLPTEQPILEFPSHLTGFNARPEPYNFLRYHANTERLRDEYVAEEFSKEALRVAFANRFFAQTSDIDGMFWGQRHTYPIEIKEKTVAQSDAVGEYFGLDVGPFVKLSYFAAKRGNMRSLFVVHQVSDVATRQHVAWHYITFDDLAQCGSWVPIAGGTNMGGGRSSTVCIPKSKFRLLDRDALSAL